ncbi:MAG: GNAT family N-acetyltransferase [Alphaproteobacteria bacterium]
MSNVSDHPLDNVVWAALTTVHAPFARGGGLARHYPRDIVPFSALAEPTTRAYADLAKDLPSGLEARLFRPYEEHAPPGWAAVSAEPIIQMIAEKSVAARPNPSGAPIVPLSINDVPDMLALTDIAKPGPFLARTVLLGSYVGVREPGGRLVAMAGERFRLPGYVEISAICTHPDARGRGLARRLIHHLTEKVFKQGHVPFLHVFPDNPATILYMRCGFRERARHWVLWHRPNPKE